jgi:hypothetical protein
MISSSLVLGDLKSPIPGQYTLTLELKYGHQLYSSGGLKSLLVDAEG